MLSQKAKYALQALAHLAGHYKDQTPVLIGTIASERQIPIKFLEAILLQLRNEDILISVRGRSGGYLLADHPKKNNPCEGNKGSRWTDCPYQLCKP